MLAVIFNTNEKLNWHVGTKFPVLSNTKVLTVIAVLCDGDEADYVEAMFQRLNVITIPVSGNSPHNSQGWFGDIAKTIVYQLMGRR